ncbi:MAG: hypothetical protein R2857_15100 [Vampirovibrionales bacterium]
MIVPPVSPPHSHRPWPTWFQTPTLRQQLGQAARQQLATGPSAHYGKHLLDLYHRVIESQS